MPSVMTVDFVETKTMFPMIPPGSFPEVPGGLALLPGHRLVGNRDAPRGNFSREMEGGKEKPEFSGNRWETDRLTPSGS